MLKTSDLTATKCLEKLWPASARPGRGDISWQSLPPSRRVAAYPRMATGNTGALRFIQWGGSNGSVTRLNNPTGPVLRPEPN